MNDLRRLCLLTAMVLGVTSGCARSTTTGVRGGPPAMMLGDFVDDYGGRFTVTAADWFQRPGNHYHVVSWHSAEQYLVAQNDTMNRSAPGKWTRIDWVVLPDQGAFAWGFCFSAYRAASRAAAEATHVVDRAHARTGCNGYPFSRMKRAGLQ